jgi:hypothetical protein
MMQGFPVLQDHEPLSSRRLAAYVSAIAGRPAPTGSEIGPFIGFVPLSGIVRPALLDLLAVRGIVSEPWSVPPAREPPYVRVAERPGVEVYENPVAVPRAFLLPSARFVADEGAALDALVGGRVDGRAQAVVVGEPGPDAAPVVAAAPGALRPARCTVDDPERVVVEFATDAPALLVLADAFAPGWRVAVDGEPRRVEQVNHLVRGVFVRPGERHAEFTYHAPGFAPGAAAAGLAWGGVGAAAVVARRRRSRQPRA